MPTIDALTGSSPFSESTHMSFERCAKEMHSLIRTSLRGYARTIEVFRELEERNQDELTKEKVQSFRNFVPLIMRISSCVLGAASVGTSLFPHLVKGSFEGLSGICPALFKPNALNEFMDKAGGGFEYLKFSNHITQAISGAQGLFTTGLEIHKNSSEANRIELDARLSKSQELERRRTTEEHDRHTESTELLQLLQQINREIAGAIRAIAGH